MEIDPVQQLKTIDFLKTNRRLAALSLAVSIFRGLIYSNQLETGRRLED